MSEKFIDWNDFKQIIHKHYPYDEWGEPRDVTENTRVEDLSDDVDGFIDVICDELTGSVSRITLGCLMNSIHDDTLMYDIFLLI